MSAHEAPAPRTVAEPVQDPTGQDGAAQVVRHEQRLRVDLERVPTERVVLRRRIVTTVRQVEVTLRREELEIARLPLTAKLAAGSAAAGPVVIVLSEEVPVVQLATRPYEQVTVRIDSTTDQQQITETVGRERIEVLTDDRSGNQHTTA